MHEQDQAHLTEPFGQRGVLPYVWPTFVVLCAIGICVCVIMDRRSDYTWDWVSNTTASRQVVVASVIGRLVVDVIPLYGSDATSSVWEFDSSGFENIRDGWQDSWQKTLGIEWGNETVRRFGGGQLSYWRLRILWRTMAFVYALPVAFELLWRLWHRYIRPERSHEDPFAVSV